MSGNEIEAGIYGTGYGRRGKCWKMASGSYLLIVLCALLVASCVGIPTSAGFVKERTR